MKECTYCKEMLRIERFYKDSYAKDGYRVKCFDQFKEFIKNSDFETVYQNWVKENYQPKFSPSVDRIDNKKDYTLGNIQIITVSENSSKKK